MEQNKSHRSLLWLAGILLLILIFVSSGLLKDTDGKTEITGSYGFEQLLYLSPLSSMTFDYAEERMRETKLTISDAEFRVDYPGQDDFIIQNPVYNKEAMTDDMIRAFENSTMAKVSISEYAERYRYTIYANEGQKTNFRLYGLDGQLWLSSYADNTADKSEIVMYLWKLK